MAMLCLSPETPQEDHHGAILSQMQKQHLIYYVRDITGSLPYSLTQKMEEEEPCLLL